MPRLNSTIKERLLKRIEKDSKTGCWNWTGFKSGGKYGGYAMIKIDSRNMLATRVSYAEFVGPIPKGYSVLHRCDNPACINPKHLWVGTQSDNMQDMTLKGRGNPRGINSRGES